MLKSLIMLITTVENSDRNGSVTPLYLSPENENQEAIVRTGHGTTDWFQIGKGVRQGCLFNLYAEYIMKNAGLDEAQAGIKIQFSSVTQSCLTLFDPMDCSHQASLSITNFQSLFKLSVR